LSQDYSKKLRLGFIGLGIAGGMMIRGVRSHPGLIYAGAADPNEKSRRAFAQDFNVPVYADAEALCANPDVDAVYIATPHQFHVEHVLAAASRGKHIIVEKPLALTLTDCHAIVQAVDAAGVRLIVGHTHSYDPNIQQMRRLIDSGEYGALKMINCWDYTNFLYRPRRPEELDTARGGGIIYNQVPHQIDLVRFLAGGKARSIRAATGIYDPSRPTEGSYQAFIEFESDVTATLVYSGYDFFDTDEYHEWIGETGLPKADNAHGKARAGLMPVSGTPKESEMRSMFAYGNPLPTALLGEGEQHQPHFGEVIVSCEGADFRPSANGVYVHSATGKQEVPVKASLGAPGWSEVVDELYLAVIHDKPLVHDARWARATVEVCLAIFDSASQKREIELQHQVFRNF
jgi:phthalate 4,5-cis-dihydrodiol dehydrogenase